ncbi:MAG TPA: hypothetical protein RMH99_26635 [Sandaracinaceae bacterium LLY-WYZ-13_1]|nr:hypothetical protein [Sandaracinaceae bacterium LLY-WYZ-13_1]
MGSEPPSGPAEAAPSLTRHALIPLSLLVCFVLVYQVRVAPWWVAVVGVPAVLLYLAAPRIGRISLSRFDRDAVQLLAGGRREGLRGRYARALGMRLFAPPALVAERRGLVAAQTGEPGRARAAYRAALDAYPEGRAPLGVRLGLAHASFALGDDEAAIRGYREVLRSSGSYPRVARNLAHALARRGEDLKEAERLAERALEEASEPSDELLLVRALVHAARGQRGPARKILARTEGVRGPAVERLREEVETALEDVEGLNRPSA